VALTDADVLHVAELARLALTDEERGRLREQLSSILGYMEMLNELDTSAILPTAQVIETSTVMRPDEPRASLDRSLALLNAPDAEGGCFKVDAVLDIEQ
jgi:aspartyl-tRNA(Asn)/glutamyl-tRNA(Gln) amidotransferase subunit C